MLSNVDIWREMEAGNIAITPSPPRERFAGASVDLTLAEEIRIFDTSKCPSIDYRALEKDPDFLLRVTTPIKLTNDTPLILHPGKVIICSTLEWIEIPNYLCAELHGRSSLARIGILPHTAGKIDPGWKGRLTLEVSNVSEIPVALYPGVAICQVVFHELSSPADLSYKEAISTYQGQTEPQVANLKNRKIK